MGRNLARNFARHGYTVALHNRTTSRTTAMVEGFGDEGNFVPAQTAEEFVQALERPRRLVIMVNAGPATDAVIDEFAPLLEPGDMIIDGGNAHFGDTRRREAKLKEQDLHFVGMGVSGGEEGALNGPSIMPGGSQESYQSLGPMLETISAHVDGTPCCTTSARTSRPLRQDGAQRHRVRRHAAHRRSLRPAQARRRLRRPRRSPRRSGPGTPAASTPT